MRQIKSYLFAAALIGLPIASHATDAAPLTRAQVRAQLIDAELSGQVPQSKLRYPDPQPDGAVKYAALRAVSETATGPSGAGQSEAGGGDARGIKRPTAVDDLYSHH